MLVSPKLNLLTAFALGYCIATSFIGVYAADVQGSCTINDKGFIGADLGSIVFVAFEYDLHVEGGNPKNKIVTGVLPDIEKFIATDISPFLIAECAPPEADTSTYADIVGIETLPKDVITADSCQSASSLNQECFRVHSEMTFYVSETGRDVETVVWLAVLRSITNQDPASWAVINPMIRNVKVDETSWVEPQAPGAQLQDEVDRINILEATEGLEGEGRGGILGFFDSIYNNKVLFWWLIAGISVFVLILIVAFLVFWYKTHKEGKTLSEGCAGCCDNCKVNCTSCWDKCKLNCQKCTDTVCCCFKSNK